MNKYAVDLKFQQKSSLQASNLSEMEKGPLTSNFFFQHQYVNFSPAYGYIASVTKNYCKNKHH